MAVQTPSPTLYVSGLETKTKKPELQASLYALFTPYGRIIDVVAKKHAGGRGQAFIVFAEQAAATTAMRALSGELLYGKELRITYSTSPSNATVARTDPSASREAAAVKAAKLVVSRAQGEYEAMEKEKEEEDARLASGLPAKRGVEEGEGEGEGEGAKRVKLNGDGGEEDEMEIEMEDDEDGVPSSNGSGSRLICTNLPPECNEAIMGALYGQYPGFASATLLPSSFSVPSSHPSPNAGAKSFAVTFDSAQQAQVAAEATKAYLMQPGWEMGVSAS